MKDHGTALFRYLKQKISQTFSIDKLGRRRGVAEALSELEAIDFCQLALTK